MGQQVVDDLQYQQCEALQISLRNILTFSSTLYDQPLQNVNEVRYLGIVIDSKLTFNTLIDSVCKKANGALSFLKRNLSSCKRQIKSDAYLIYVRPILEYAVCSWAPPILSTTLTNWNLYNDEQQD